MDRLCHIWCDLRVLEHLDIRIPKGVSSYKETKRIRYICHKHCDQCGAYINKRLKLNMTDSARMCFIVALLGLVSCGAFLLRCNTPSIAGVNALYSNSSDPHQLSAPCNQACNCGKVDYTPVCDGPLNYFSPCHAGCNRINTTTKGSFYSNCACAAKSGGSARQVKKGNCYIDCGLKFLLFMVAVTLTPLLTFMNNTPGLVVTLRYVTF